MDKSLQAKKNLTDKRFYLWVTMSRVRYAIFRAREAELRPHDITPEQSGVLIVVRELNNQATPAEIARWLFRKPNTVSTILKTMERKGFIKRNKDAYVKNLIRVLLTDKGEQVYHRAQSRESVERIMSILSEEECDCLQACFDKLMAKARIELKIGDVRPIFPGIGLDTD